MKDELERRQSNTVRLRQFFAQHPNQWIDARELEPIGGRQAWRTRVSELRQQLEKENAGTIENRLIRRPLLSRDEEGVPDRLYLGVVVKSEYRYLPHKPIGRDAGEYQKQPELF